MDKAIEFFDTAVKFNKKLAKETAEFFHRASQIKNDYNAVLVQLKQAKAELDEVKADCQRQVQSANDAVAQVYKKAEQVMREAEYLKSQMQKELDRSRVTVA